MAVTGIGNHYNVYESAYTAQKHEATQGVEAKETAATQQENKIAATGNKKEDYYSYLSKKYDCVRNGDVAIAGAYLRKCANDPEKAKELEENLSLYKELHEKGYQNAKQNAARLGARLVSYSESWSIDSTGNITMVSSTTVTTDTGAKSQKEIREELEERLKEKKEEAKKAEKAKAEKEEKQEDAFYSKFDVGI